MRNRLRFLMPTFLLVMTTATHSAPAEDDQSDLLSLQSTWAAIQYQYPQDQRAKALKTLSDQAKVAVHEHPGNPDFLIWRGIILSTYAGAKGGLGALSLVEEAKESLEAALKLNEQALAGSAHTSLGSLYYQVPGWPLSFGDDEKAEQHLKSALAINPAGIDPNYFYGDYLIEEGRMEEARYYLNMALQAPPRPGRSSADEGRREEIRQLLGTLN